MIGDDLPAELDPQIDQDPIPLFLTIVEGQIPEPIQGWDHDRIFPQGALVNRLIDLEVSLRVTFHQFIDLIDRICPW